VGPHDTSGAKGINGSGVIVGVSVGVLVGVSFAGSTSETGGPSVRIPTSSGAPSSGVAVLDNQKATVCGPVASGGAEMATITPNDPPAPVVPVSAVMTSMPGPLSLLPA
jgi:hypothetical protein